MKHVKNKMKIILFTFLIVAMILPFGVMNFADAQTDESLKTKIDRLGNAFGEKYQQWLQEESQSEKQKIRQQMDKLVRSLENYGITYTIKYMDNKSFWAEKSSRHLEPSFIENSWLPMADATSNPYFYTGYYHDCWWILACPEWNGSGIQLGENQSGIRTVSLISDHSWSNGHYKVMGSDLHVDFNYVSKLKSYSLVKQTVTGSDTAIFFYSVTHSQSVDDEYDNPKDSWKYSIQYSVSNIT